MGIHRKVELKNSHVVKIARNRISRYCNQLECELSGSSIFLAPVISHSEDFSEISMVRVSIPGIGTRMRHARFLRRELRGTRISDIRWYNVGEWSGRPVLYDYGGSLVIIRIIARKIRSEFATRHTHEAGSE